MQTYWNGEPCKATKVQVVVGKPLRPTWWCAHLEGKVHPAIKIECDGSEPFYIDDQPQSWTKITVGLGSPSYGHRSVPVAREIESETL